MADFLPLGDLTVDQSYSKSNSLHLSQSSNLEIIIFYQTAIFVNNLFEVTVLKNI